GVLVDQVQALFPKVDGEVIEVQNGTVTLALGSKDGLVAGVELALYRQGRELRHPKTGEVLGRTEQQLGRLAVQQVFEAYSTGTASQGSEVQPGDRARISAGKIKLSVVPLIEPGVREALADAAVHEMIDALNRTGRFQIGLGDAIGVWINQQGGKRDEVLAGKGLDAIAERFKVDNLLVVAFSRVQAKPYMDVRLFSFPGASTRLNTALFVPPSIKPAAKGDYSASGQKRDNQTPNPQRSFLARLLYGELDAGTYSSGEQAIPLKEVAKFPFIIASMDMAVGSKDRIPRMVITDGERVWLYRITPERVLEPEWTYKGDSRARVFSVQLAELSNDATIHVVVNRYSAIPAILVNSLILTTKDQKAVVAVDEVNEILIAVDANGDGVKKTLWAQSFAQTGFFKQGDATRMTLRNGKLVSDGKVRVPSSFRATGATFSNVNGKGERALAFIDEFNRLRIAVGNDETFRSSAPVGTGMAKLGVETQIERGGRTYVYSPEPMPLSVDLDGDGIEEIVVAQNQIPGRLAVIYKGPAGYRFQTVNSGFEGTVMALGAVPGEGGPPSLVAAVVRYTNFRQTEGETQIIMTTSSE
ncbi:MAG TPA: hypothetical protein VET45_00850, partial [Candidatus Binatia bacterium]|nr:hypothetical protein [Candidatus Binatia bacterium]